ncbi:hypothetical protein GGI1_24486 [Acidithiobacillus sp. GGI-221]|nr:hypothetical protein GGI1_24486 [Acidithiobacillus sp. GGI-221]
MLVAAVLAVRNPVAHSEADTAVVAVMPVVAGQEFMGAASR